MSFSDNFNDFWQFSQNRIIESFPKRTDTGFLHVSHITFMGRFSPKSPRLFYFLFRTLYPTWYSSIRFVFVTNAFSPVVYYSESLVSSIICFISSSLPIFLAHLYAHSGSLASSIIDFISSSSPIFIAQ